mgnify:CR=1 FL=1
MPFDQIMKQSDEVGMVSGFGKLCVKEKHERRGRNPATGEDMMLEPKRVVNFMYLKQNPFEERQNAIRKWKKFGELDIEEKESVLNITRGLTEIGLKAKDALHIACAIEGKANYFLTTDDEILKKCSTYKEVGVINPLEFLIILEELK